MAAADNFEAGTTVLAKLKGFPAWPAVVVRSSDLPEAVRSAKPKKKDLHPVLFYSDFSFMWATSAELRVLSTEEAKEMAEKGTRLKKALRDAFRVASDPPNFKEYLLEAPGATAKPTKPAKSTNAAKEPASSSRRSSRNIKAKSELESEPEVEPSTGRSTRSRQSATNSPASSSRKRKSSDAKKEEETEQILPQKLRRTSSRNAPVAAAAQGRISSRAVKKESKPESESNYEAGDGDDDDNEDSDEVDNEALGEDGQGEGDDYEDDQMEVDGPLDDGSEKAESESEDNESGEQTLNGDSAESARILLPSLKSRGRQSSKPKKQKYASDKEISESSELRLEFCRNLRTELQKAFLHDNAIDESDLSRFCGYFKQLQNIKDLELSVVRSTKLNRAVRLVTERNDLPQSAGKVIEACKKALKLWDVKPEPIIRGRPEDEVNDDDEPTHENSDDEQPEAETEGEQGEPKIEEAESGHANKSEGQIKSETAPGSLDGNSNPAAKPGSDPYGLSGVNEKPVVEAKSLADNPKPDEAETESSEKDNSSNVADSQPENKAT